MQDATANVKPSRGAFHAKLWTMVAVVCGLIFAASQMLKRGDAALLEKAREQIKAGSFEDAEATILRIDDPVQFNLNYPIIAAEMAKREGGSSHARRLFDHTIKAIMADPDQQRRDRELYLICHRQWEGGLYSDARKTAELIKGPDCKATLLDLLSDSAQLQVAREQAGVGRFNEAEATVKQNVKDTYRYCEALISIASAAATNAQPAHARRIFAHALGAAQQIESPGGRDDMIAQITLRQGELGFQAESHQSFVLINHPGIKDEVLKKLARVKPLGSNL